MPEEIKKYVGPFSGPQMDQIFYEILNYTSERFAKGTAGGVPVAAGTPGYNDNSLFYKNQAAAQVSLAQAAAAAAANSAQRAESAVPAGTDAAVLWTRDQSTELTADDKAVARKNIMAGGTNPNLLDNPWFTVNQRGQANYTGNTFTVDRWSISSNASNSLAVGSGSITLNVVAGNVFRQNLEPEIIEAGKTYTLSVMDSTGNIYTSSITATTGEVTAALGTIDGVPMRWEIDGRYSTTRWGILIYSTVAWSITIKAVKLELGSVSTLANDAPPCYAEELMKCQRYFIRLAGSYAPVGFGAVASVTLATCMVPLPVPMRANPTITLTGTLYTNGRAAIAVQSFTTARPSGNAIGMNVTSTGTLTIGEAVILQIRDATSHLDFSADL